VDSLTQIALGATIAAAVVPAGQRRRALLYGAALGTLPDLDVLVRYADPVADFTYHRSFSHSLFVLTLAAPLLWALARYLDAQIRQAPARWLLAFWLVLFTHPLLDAMTIYGTQLWWPFDTTPVGIGSVFIIDPLYSLPLLIACAWAAWRPLSRYAARALPVALVLSSVYLGWSVLAQQRVEQVAREALLAEADSHQNIQILALPSPFNTLLWRVLVRENGGYREGYYSLLSDSEPGPWRHFASADELAPAMDGHWAFERLAWFTRGYYAIRSEADAVVVTDLRMGSEPAYVFSFVVARIDEDGGIVPITSEQQSPLRPVGDALSWLLTRVVTPGHAMATSDEVLSGAD
jgi:inner membrane protein